MGRLDTAPERPRIARNTIFSAIGEGSNLLLFFLGFLAARYLAPEAFGAYSAAFAFVGIFRILPDFGMAYASTLEISRNRSLAGRLIGNLLGFQGVLSLLTVALCLGLGRMLFPAPDDRITWTAVVVLSFDLVLKSAKSTLRWLLKGFQRFGTEAVSLLLERVALLALGLASLRAGQGAIGFVLVFVIVRLFDTSGLWAYINARVLRLRPARDPALWAELLRKGLPFAYVGLVITLLFQVDIVLVERLRGAVEAGFYSAPVRILEGLTLVPRILGYALLPTMAALNARSPAAVGDLYRRGLKYLLLAGLPVAAFGLLASAPFIRLVFGPDYEPSIPLSRVLLPTALFMFLSNFSETTLACVNRWGTIVVTSTLALFLNVALNVVWIPLYGGTGAALARLVAEGTYALLTVGALHVYGYRTRWASVALRPLLAAGAFATALWLSRALGLLAAAGLASAVFLLATLLLGVWDATERATLRGLFRREPRTPADSLGPKEG
jgi:O-antigen/teichoic acid export membrane protein